MTSERWQQHYVRINQRWEGLLIKSVDFSNGDQSKMGEITFFFFLHTCNSDFVMPF